VFDSVDVVRNVEERFEILRRTAACVTLNREQVSELIAITANLIEERKRIRTMLDRLPERFGEVRQLLNELSRTLR
jgi:Tfp pilus assembly protein PilO